MAYIERLIDLTITLGEGNFGLAGQNTIKLTGLRVHALISKWGAPSLSTAVIRVFGMTASQMNAISTLWVPVPQWRYNSVTVNAGDAQSGMPIAFFGGIKTALADLNGQPDTSFVITALAAYEAAMKPPPATSFNGPVDAATVLASIASQMGLNFENNGVSVILSSPYYDKTLWDQAKRCAEAAGIYLFIDDTTSTLAIYPKSGFRAGAPVVVSPATGMVGYPQYTGSWLAAKTLYNPSLAFGKRFKMESSIQPANGLWTIRQLTHNLQSKTFGGAWFSEFEGYAGVQ